MDKYNLAKQLHSWYEEASKEVGWETQEECKVAFDNLPEKNKQVMLVVAEKLDQQHKEQYEKGFIDGSDLTGGQASDIMEEEVEKKVKERIREVLESLDIETRSGTRTDDYYEGFNYAFQIIYDWKKSQLTKLK